MLESDEVTLPAPGGGDTVAPVGGAGPLGSRRPAARAGSPKATSTRWRSCASWARGRTRDACYGVWAARPGGIGAELGGDPRRLTGTVRFCSGARDLDRALVVAAAPERHAAGRRRARPAGCAPGRGHAGPRRGCGRATPSTSSSTTSPSPTTTLVGPPDSYLARPGFWWGGGGVAAVWLGGAAGVLDDVLDRSCGTRRTPPRARRRAARRAAGGRRAARAHRRDDRRRPDRRAPHGRVDGAGRGRTRCAAPCWTGRRSPAASRASPSSATLGTRLADLQVFVRQHHGERDLAALGAAVAEGR